MLLLLALFLGQIDTALLVKIGDVLDILGLRDTKLAKVDLAVHTEFLLHVLNLGVCLVKLQLQDMTL